MDFTEFNLGLDDEGRRLDRILRIFLKNSSLSELYSLIRKNLIRINDKKTSADYKIQHSDKLKIASFLLEKQNLKSENENKSSKIESDLKIILKTDDLIFINKPYDIEVHGKNNSLNEKVKILYESCKKNSSLSFVPGPLHRLDKKTTGIIAFSQSLKGAKWFSENIKNHKIQKTYIAVLEGHIAKNEHWEDFINQTEKSKENNFYKVKISQNQTSEKEKKAITDIFPLENLEINGKKITIAKINIKTGRTHQIRSQSALHGFPLLGDNAYGAKKINSNRDFFLHAAELSLPANPLNLPQKIICDYKKDLEEFLKNI